MNPLNNPPPKTVVPPPPVEEKKPEEKKPPEEKKKTFNKLFGIWLSYWLYELHAFIIKWILALIIFRRKENLNQTAYFPS